ncbi:GGDEF domain-containing protein, partial [Burkholderia cenocepacia]|uniref:GGDEF domain-containing protein n=1 Tax=Burkholderia cenocepacia TaxID=95486 RepID=UPI0024B76245
GLTGIATRRFFEARLGDEFARWQRYGGDLSVLLFDLDHFKTINDRFGHAAGDAVLRETAPRWGALDRHYIKCLQDRVILPALQQRFIDEADAFAPGNPTHVHQLDSSHSPFVSQPASTAGVLADIAKG